MVDIENLVGGSDYATVGSCALAFQAYREASGYRAGDLVIVGAGPTAFVPAGLAWRGIRMVRGRGVDGADFALLNALGVELTLGRFGRLAIGSGDGILAVHAQRLRASGHRVDVICNPTKLAHRLRAVADECFGLAIPVAAAAA